MPIASIPSAVFLRRVRPLPQKAIVPVSAGTNWQARWIIAFMAIGIAVRLIRYLLRFPLWGDESLLAVNFLDRDYAGLMRPLDCHQVAPLLFLWTELTAIKLLGFHEWTLRLVPLLSGVASLFLFQRLAKHLLTGTALVLAVGIFAVNYSSIRYSCEVKPYGIDLMVSTLLLLLTVRWWKQPDRARWLWLLAAVMPIALGLSFPAVFVAGGASIAIGAILLRSRSMRTWAAWIALNVIIAASFFGWYWFGIRAQAQAELGIMAVDWRNAFPPSGSLVGLVVWLLRTHAGPLFAVPVGGDHWGSIGTFLLCITAAAVLARQGRYRPLLLCAAPLALNLIAAALHRYPYGGHMRLAMHVVPIVSLLAAVGAAQWLKGFAAEKSRHSWPLAAACGFLFVLAVISTARDFYFPGKEQHDIRNRDFAAWFWGSMERGHEVACTENGLPPGLPSISKTGRGCAAPSFLCNERIYSPQQAHGKPCNLNRVTSDHPLACVQYWSHFTPYDPAIFAQWLGQMQQRYDLVSKETYPMLQDNDNDRQPEPADHVDVYEFVPKRPIVASR